MFTKLAAWRLQQARERDLAVNFVVREEHLWQVARYMTTSLGELDSLDLSGPEIRYHGKTLIALVSQAAALDTSALPAPLLNLMNWHWKLKDSQPLPELISNWRGDLLAAPLQKILKNY